MRSRGLAVASVGMLLLTAGCSVTGTVKFTDEVAIVDLVVTDPSVCDEAATMPPGIAIRMLPEENSCAVTGTTPIASPSEGDPSWLDIVVSKQAGVWQVVVPASDLSSDDGGEIDITLGFPTPIAFAAGGATIEGSTVRWTDLASARTEGIAATTRAPAGPLPAWLVPALAGSLIGGVTITGLGWVRRRTILGPPENQTPTPDQAPATPASSGNTLLGDQVDPRPPQPPEDPEVWSRP
ncbi:MAG: hypothetical protein Q4F65_07530 [Propionibacteriaceae bacterium]|nr:hypothetical protein [Propionibacteriaceae bacterium]